MHFLILQTCRGCQLYMCIYSKCIWIYNSVQLCTSLFCPISSIARLMLIELRSQLSCLWDDYISPVVPQEHEFDQSLVFLVKRTPPHWCHQYPLASIDIFFFTSVGIHQRSTTSVGNHWDAPATSHRQPWYCCCATRTTCNVPKNLCLTIHLQWKSLPRHISHKEPHGAERDPRRAQATEPTDGQSAQHMHR